jgi:DEAD/DEAH box helicase domain-containing protein
MGVLAPSRPDFLIWPAKSSSVRRPIAVFCDGWTYHQNKLRDDAVKRNAIVQSGRFWVWSITSDDVKEALDGKLNPALESPLVSMNRHDGAIAKGRPLETRSYAFAENSMAQLVRLLEKEETPSGDPVQVELKKNAAWTTFLMVENPGNSQELALLTADFERIWPLLPSGMPDKAEPAALSGSRTGSTPTVRLYWPRQFLQGNLNANAVPGVVLHEDARGEQNHGLQTRWRRWLWVFNTLQALPGVLLVTQRGLDGRDYDVLLPAMKPTEPAKSPQGVAEDAAWASVKQSALEAIRSRLDVLSAEGAAAPEQVGYEYADDKGNVMAEAELAWESARVVLLVGNQSEFTEVWKSLDWRPVIAEGDWSAVILEHLRSEKETES